MACCFKVIVDLPIVSQSRPAGLHSVLMPAIAAVILAAMPACQGEFAGDGTSTGTGAAASVGTGSESTTAASESSASSVSGASSGSGETEDASETGGSATETSSDDSAEGDPTDSVSGTTDDDHEYFCDFPELANVTVQGTTPIGLFDVQWAFMGSYVGECWGWRIYLLEDEELRPLHDAWDADEIDYVPERALEIGVSQRGDVFEAYFARLRLPEDPGVPVSTTDLRMDLTPLGDPNVDPWTGSFEVFGDGWDLTGEFELRRCETFDIVCASPRRTPPE